MTSSGEKDCGIKPPYFAISVEFLSTYFLNIVALPTSKPPSMILHIEIFPSEFHSSKFLRSTP